MVIAIATLQLCTVCEVTCHRQAKHVMISGHSIFMEAISDLPIRQHVTQRIAITAGVFPLYTHTHTTHAHTHTHTHTPHGLV